ncbi:PaaI family thioesterase [Jannaschia sp. CCS1]|uniref:PaaI family thioesterase n=1 Tax=Jannaschia sp. (strain CCS1) TaxID=290400 RepID=UPI00031F6424|nr:PaaI family thioesterase [Jannaschia sp. CCS1]
MNEMKAQEIRESFARQGLMETLGCKISHLEQGRVVLELPISGRVSQQHGVAHAGATFAIGDSASGYAALSVMEDGAEVMTVEMKINLIAPAAGQRLLATGDVVKAGRRLVITRCTVQAEAEDGSLRDVALLQGTMIPL